MMKATARALSVQLLTTPRFVSRGIVQRSRERRVETRTAASSSTRSSSQRGVRVGVRGKDVFVEGRKRCLVAARKPQQAIREHAFGIRDDGR